MKVTAPRQDNQNATIKIFTSYGEIIESELPYRDCKVILDEYHKNKRENAFEMLIIFSDEEGIERRFVRMDSIVEINIKTTKRQ